MRVNLEPTTEFSRVNGVECRVWQGETDQGVKVHAYIALLQVPEGGELGAFEEALKELNPSLSFWPVPNAVMPAPIRDEQISQLPIPERYRELVLPAPERR